jgi:hypothetical protein
MVFDAVGNCMQSLVYLYDPVNAEDLVFHSQGF